MEHSKHFEKMAKNISNTLKIRQTEATNFLITLQKEIFNNMESAVLYEIGTAPANAKKLIVTIALFHISTLATENKTITVTCNSYFSDDNIKFKDNIILGTERIFDFRFARNVTMYNSNMDIISAEPEEIEYFRFRVADFYTDITPKELFPDGFMFEISLEE